MNTSTSTQGVKDALTQKYDARRWYLEPTDDLEREASALNAPAFSATTPSSAHSAHSVPAMSVPTPLAAIARTAAQASTAQANASASATGALSKPAAGNANAASASAVQSGPRTQSLDILADVFADTAAPPPYDPFASSASASASVKAPADLFATAASPFQNSTSGRVR